MLSFRKSIKIDKNTRINLSKTGGIVHQQELKVLEVVLVKKILEYIMYIIENS
ncbi:DUF4236 domain-containing protein [Clostridium botulinum]|uniref:hypothetical protein n=1 Tax=Clostridium botulinum TaxID=1491 RepID=UPI00016BBAF0|nr:hypothetical protein [Clostridium botulinum]MBY6878107.1 DUF4236 domain-containing protein [Clostridium botulinum]MBY6881454.1 DUF4236 domain-containing protein [Clostridium botulinum]MBY6895418.1 DUF4236 domain-containing protein [Clostridium botulinum]MBY6902490.1 DUF4236 domain-containing protein [Clostridium botulinum]HDI3053820.1 DUF4236 domain-containing protein [Clostridium botulinum]